MKNNFLRKRRRQEAAQLDSQLKKITEKLFKDKMVKPDGKIPKQA